MYKASQNRLRMRMYNVLKDVRRQHAFVPIVIRPSLSPDYRPRVNWSEFHETVPLEKAATLYRASMVPKDLPTVTSRIHPKAITGAPSRVCLPVCHSMHHEQGTPLAAAALLWSPSSGSAFASVIVQGNGETSAALGVHCW